jgi:hypothetical protein
MNNDIFANNIYVQFMRLPLMVSMLSGQTKHLAKEKFVFKLTEEIPFQKN